MNDEGTPWDYVKALRRQPWWDLELLLSTGGSFALASLLLRYVIVLVNYLSTPHAHAAAAFTPWIVP